MKKTFDCVEMKNRLQAELKDREARLGAEEMRRQQHQWLERGDDPLARWWRSLSNIVSTDSPCLVVHENAGAYAGQPSMEAAP